MRARADQLLVERGLVQSRARAQAEIRAGRVTANGRPLRKPSEVIAPDTVLSVDAINPYVSRGALKLISAFDTFAVSPAGKTVLDIGASTGGFTQVALARGATHVTAIDVGHGQLHPTLAGDPRVTMIEGMNARDLTAERIVRTPDLIVVDVSFISLKLVLPPALALSAPQAQLIALIKPQFEAGRDALSKGGVVKDASVHARVCADIRAFLGDKGWQVIGLMQSPILGGDGNTEFLIGASRG